MNAFIEKHQKNIIGVLSGWDRIVFRGTLRLVANLAGMNAYLWHLGILMKDFKQYALDKTAQLIQASVAKAEQAGRQNVYLHSSRTNKEQVALEIAARDITGTMPTLGSWAPASKRGFPLRFRCG